MQVKVVDLVPCKDTQQIEDAINAELNKLQGHFINDVKISPDIAMCLITYTESKK